MATYQMVTFGGLAIGSWLWGVVGDQASLPASLFTSGVLMALSALLGWKLPISQAGSINVEPMRAWPEPKTSFDVSFESGPVVVTVEYQIAPEHAEDFVSAMNEVRRIRRRDGARRWTLLQDVAEPDRWIERFQSPTWVEHLRHHHRFTVGDQEIERRALAFHRGPKPPKIRHLLERPPASFEAPRTDEERISERAVATDPNLPPATMSVSASPKP
jgi:quinol monooxygenase YgiN